MKPRWAVRFPKDFVSEIAAFWNTRGVEVSANEHSEYVWVRGAEKSVEIDAILRSFLSGKRFDVLERMQLKSPMDLGP